MGKITLREKVLSEGKLNRNIIVSCNFIKELEVYGFMNCKDREDVLSGIAFGGTDLEGDVQINSSDCIVYSFFMRQNNIITPIYHTIEVCTHDIDINVAEIHIPSFRLQNVTYQSKLYHETKFRYGQGKIVSEQEWEKAKMPSKYSLVDGKVMMHVKKGEIVFKDKYDCIKSVEEEAIVLCRFPHGESGDMKYVTLGLDQLFVDSKNEAKS